MDDNFIHDVGQRIRKIRKEKRMTMKELAEKTDLHESTISRYEKGEIAILKMYIPLNLVKSLFFTTPSKLDIDLLDGMSSRGMLII